MAAASLLSPLQRAFLNDFFGTAIGQRFFLTGGTALAEYYLQHRYSDDLDLFTVDDEAFGFARREVQRLAGALSVTAESIVSTPTFQRFELIHADAPPVRLDLVRDIDFQFGQRQFFGAVIVDSLENIGANKISAIFGRTEGKDFVDLYFILQTGHDLARLIDDAKQKDSGISEFWLAGMFRQVDALTRLPTMLKPLDLETLKTFYLELADDLLRHIKPGQ
jgi:predicted nucleotidyltransferase component of viral defense system